VTRWGDIVVSTNENSLKHASSWMKTRLRAIDSKLDFESIQAHLAAIPAILYRWRASWTNRSTLTA